MVHVVGRSEAQLDGCLFLKMIVSRSLEREGVSWMVRSAAGPTVPFFFDKKPKGQKSVFTKGHEQRRHILEVVVPTYCVVCCCICLCR